MSEDIVKFGSELAGEWLQEDGPGAVMLKERLQPAGGDDSPVFPPTFAALEDKDEKVVAKAYKPPWMIGKSDYNISELRDGNLCTIDTLGSQANAMETLFKGGDYAELVPQVIVVAGEKRINLLDVAHRAADAYVRCSDLADELRDAFIAWRDNGDAGALAKIAPTSLVFGVWDSRDTHAKCSRLIDSTIDATNVERLWRSAQYSPPIDYGDETEGLLADIKGDRAKAGFTHVPSVRQPGGVLVGGEIRHKVELNLVSLRELRSTDAGATDRLQRYMLGLSLTAVTMTEARCFNLRQGCLLVRHPDSQPLFEIVHANGTRPPFSITHRSALEFAKAAARNFSVGQDRTVRFDKNRAGKMLVQPKKDKETKKKS